MYNTVTAKVNILNVDSTLHKYIVVRFCKHELGDIWYYDSWDDKAKADEVAAELFNAFVVERDDG